MQKFSPRRPNSQWSKLNKTRVKRLTEQGRMAPPGLEKIRAAKASGRWDAEYADRPQTPSEIPEELKRALARNPEAKRHFDQLPPSYRKQFIGWIAVAKRQETRDRRVVDELRSGC